jgi:uncharacterized protein YgbK (DUF1537 family)
MEVTAFAGLPTVLFLQTPTPEQLAQFTNYRVVGIAGIARSQGPEWWSAICLRYSTFCVRWRPR